MYHGGGGFIHSEVYNMPIWMRHFYIKSINKFLKEQKEKEEEQINKQKGTPSKNIMGPNIKPSSTDNFKK